MLPIAVLPMGSRDALEAVPIRVLARRPTAPTMRRTAPGQGQRHGVHRVGATGPATRLADGLGDCRFLRRCASAGSGVLRYRHHRSCGYLDDVVALAEVDVVVGMDRSDAARSRMRDHLVGVFMLLEVPEPGKVDRELFACARRRSRPRRRGVAHGRGRRARLISAAEALDQRQRLDDPTQWLHPEMEIVDGALGLRAPQCVRGTRNSPMLSCSMRKPRVFPLAGLLLHGMA